MVKEDTFVEIAGQRFQQIMDEAGDHVAVAVSYGYGAGWSSWEDVAATNMTVIRAKLEGRDLTPEETLTWADSTT